MYDIVVIATVITAGIGLATFFLGRLSVKHSEGKSAGEMAADIKHIHTSIAKIENSINEMRARQEKRDEKDEEWRVELIDRVSGVEESLKSAHKRINKLEEKAS